MINTSNWKYFKISTIFKKYKIKKYQKTHDTKGSIPFVSSTSFNNGVASYTNSISIPGGCITISTNGKCFDCFFHEEKISVSSDVEVLYLEKMNKYIGLFLCTVLKLQQEKYNFGIKPKNNAVWDTLIKLPAKNETPDWEYMEQYIKSLKNSDLI